MSFDETRAFFDGLQYLPDDYKNEFIEMLESDPELIYPLYINFKAKLKALEDESSEKSWEEVVENELKELEEKIGKDL